MERIFDPVGLTSLMQCGSWFLERKERGREGGSAGRKEGRMEGNAGRNKINR